MQLNSEYGENESITANCHVRVVFAPNEVKTAEWISKMLGSQTVLKENYSTSGKKTAVALDSVTSSIQEVQRSLLTPDEVMRIPGAVKDAKGNVTAPGDLLIFVSGHPPIYGKQILYFKDPVFSERSKLPPCEKADTLVLQRGNELVSLKDERQTHSSNAVLVAALALPLCVLLGAMSLFGVSINLTPSFPFGLYQTKHGFEAQPDIGSLVTVNIVDDGVFKEAIESGYLSLDAFGNPLPLLKQVAASAGDRVELVEGRVFINGTPLENGHIRRTDSKGRSVQAATGGVVPNGYVWLHSDHNLHSYDSRYFGFVPTAWIDSVVTPLWVFK